MSTEENGDRSTLAEETFSIDWRGCDELGIVWPSAIPCRMLH